MKEDTTVPAPGLQLDAKTPVAVPVSTQQQPVEMARELSQQWNTKNLGFRLGADAASAACAASMIAPVISIIDRFVLSPPMPTSKYAPTNQS
ncbi:hypothetical protein O1611_g5777 [Lasiodiplodia mahajangana]|uniref:Uncharacterized protein n=1 Tax=Lasiodiplodia mahajangana TaxID=1108764 RepID=A0ACC2JK73_9PEZI|nr:hypothetical protein O1611_g5777 [Lasiodiplodia mahajangana]